MICVHNIFNVKYPIFMVGETCLPDISPQSLILIVIAAVPLAVFAIKKIFTGNRNPFMLSIFGFFITLLSMIIVGSIGFGIGCLLNETSLHEPDIIKHSGQQITCTAGNGVLIVLGSTAIGVVIGFIVGIVILHKFCRKKAKEGVSDGES